MKNPTNDDAYDVLFRSYELANKRIKDLERQLAEVTAQNARLTEAADWDTLNALSDEVEDYKKQLAYEQERNLNNVANADLQITEMQAEVTRLREQFRRAGGCACEQGTTQYCATAQRLERRVAQCWEYVPIRVREILQSQWRRDEQQVGLLEIADDVIAEREAAKGER